MADYPYVYLGIAEPVVTTKDSKPVGVPVLGLTRLYAMRASRVSTGAFIRWNVWGIADPTGAYSGVSTSDLAPASIVIAGEA